jgi:hypothetical protein
MLKTACGAAYTKRIVNSVEWCVCAVDSAGALARDAGPSWYEDFLAAAS